MLDAVEGVSPEPLRVAEHNLAAARSALEGALRALEGSVGA
jgi:hypothetical protein